MAYRTMNGLMNASVSLGSSQRPARVTGSPHVSVPSGAAAAGPVRAESSSSATSGTIRQRMTRALMAPPLGGVDGGPDGRGDQLQDPQHLREIIAAEVEHHVAEPEPLVLTESVNDGLMPLSQELVAENETDGELDGLERTLGHVSGRTQPVEAVLELRRRLRRRVPAVAQRDHPSEGTRTVAADPDRRMGLLHGLGREADVVEAEELTFEGGVLRRPKLLEHAQDLVGLAAPRVEGSAQDLELLLPPTDADATDQASAREGIDARV